MLKNYSTSAKVLLLTAVVIILVAFAKRRG